MERTEIEILNEEIKKLENQVKHYEDIKGVSRDFADFAKRTGDMLGGINAKNYRTSELGSANEYSLEEIKEIILNSNEKELRALSKAYYNRSGLYKRMIKYLATSLTYDYLIIPKASGKPSEHQITEAMNGAYDIIRKFDVEANFASIISDLLVEGVYYGFLKEYDNKFVFQKVEPHYCRSRFISANGMKLMEFNLNYFYSIQGDTLITDEALLSTFPVEIQKAYKQFLGKIGNKSGKNGEVKLKSEYRSTVKDSAYNWVLVPENVGVVFYYDDKKPFLTTVVDAIANLEDYKGLEKKLDKQELAKILIQKLPMNEDGELIFTTAEAAEIHRAGVNMLANNTNVDVMTTFADVEMIDLQKSGSANRDNLEKIERSIYNEAGLSKNLFASDGNIALDYSVRTDCALVYDMAKQFMPFMDYHLNRKSKKNKIFLVFLLLPITQYNREEMFDLYLKAAEYGYSKLLPGIAAGVKQSDMIDLMHYENKVLKLQDIMVPVQSAHTTSGNQEAGAPEKKDSKKQDKTLNNDESK